MILAARRKRPCGCGSGDKCDELPSLHGTAFPGDTRPYHILDRPGRTCSVSGSQSSSALRLPISDGPSVVYALRGRCGVERAAHLLRDALHGAMAYANFVSDL